MKKDKRYNQGRYKPVNPEKYVGDINDIVYRSSWEFKLCRWLDTNKSVLYWNSEGVVIPYVSPVDNRVHRYYVDFVVSQRNKNGDEETILIEVKPHAQTKPPRPAKDRRGERRFIRESMTYAVNQAKWEAASAFCKKKGWKWIIMTEYELGIKKKP